MKISNQEQSKIDEDKVRVYLESFGLEALRYSKKEQRAVGKNPDFKVYQNKELVFYAEVKSIFVDENELGHKQMLNNLAKKLHSAFNQFLSVNNRHEFPNVLFWCSNAMRADINKFIDFHNGYVSTGLAGKGDVFKDFRKTDVVEKSNIENRIIDLHIWVQHDEFKQVFGNQNWKHITKISDALKLFELSFS